MPFRFFIRGAPENTPQPPDDSVIAILIAFIFVLIVWAVALGTRFNLQTEASAAAPSVAAVVDAAHDPLLEMDFFRISYVPADTAVDHTTRPDALRAFFGASRYFLPPMPLATMAKYPGLTSIDPRKLVAIRCKPADPTKVQPMLATWPNVFQAITADLASQKLTCPPPGGGGAADAEKETTNKIYCAAQSFNDTPGANATTILSDAMKAATDVFADPKAKDWLIKNYGIYPAFSGLGLSVKDSYTLDQQNMNAAMMLQNSITPEYLLRNTTLEQAGCRCIAVPYYPERNRDLMDLDFVWQQGGQGSCTEVKRLGPAGSQP